jgi:YggT family protein
MKALFIVILYALDFYIYVVVAAVILSWLIAFNVINTQNQFVQMVWQFLYQLTEPLLRRIRRVLPQFGNLDLSPLVLFFGIMLVQLIIKIYVLPNVP